MLGLGAGGACVRSGQMAEVGMGSEVEGEPRVDHGPCTVRVRVRVRVVGSIHFSNMCMHASYCGRTWTWDAKLRHAYNTSSLDSTNPRISLARTLVSSLPPSPIALHSFNPPPPPTPLHHATLASTPRGHVRMHHFRPSSSASSPMPNATGKNQYSTGMLAVSMACWTRGG